MKPSEDGQSGELKLGINGLGRIGKLTAGNHDAEEHPEETGANTEGRRGVSIADEEQFKVVAVLKTFISLVEIRIFGIRITLKIEPKAVVHKWIS